MWLVTQAVSSDINPTIRLLCSRGGPKSTHRSGAGAVQDKEAIQGATDKSLQLPQILMPFQAG